jgi:hypothetical protein
LEGWHIKLKRLGIALERRSRGRLGGIPFTRLDKKLLVHLPELALLASALGCLRSQVRLRMVLADREILINIEDLTGIDKLGLELRVRRTDVAAAERSAIV